MVSTEFKGAGLHYTAFRDAIREDSRQITPSRGVSPRKKFAVKANVESRVKVEESSASGEGRLSKAVLTQTDEGEVVKKTVTRENIEAVKETLTVRSAAILSGVVTLKTVKIPDEGSKTAGEIQVTLGISTKTLAAAAEAHNMITDSLNARRMVGEKTKGPAGSKKTEAPAGGANRNKPEVRKNDTLF